MCELFNFLSYAFKHSAGTTWNSLPVGLDICANFLNGCKCIT